MGRLGLTDSTSLELIVSHGLLPRAQLIELSDRPYVLRYVEPWTTPERWRLLDDYVTLSLEPDRAKTLAEEIGRLASANGLTIDVRAPMS